MGNSSINCFKNGDRTSTIYRLPKNSHEMASIINLKNWKQFLGYSHTNRSIQFDYPADVQHQAFKQIKKDITRTYPQATFFVNNNNNLQIFNQVLCKIAVYLPRVGYTQGMNFVAGFFLLSGMPQQQTFSMCIKIFTNYDMMCLGMYEDEFPLTRIYCALFWEILRIHKSQLHSKMVSFTILDEMWVFQWFMTFFIYSFPIQIIPQIWNFLFFRKEFAFVSIAVAFVTKLQKQILKCESDIDFMNLMEEIKKYDSYNKYLKTDAVVSEAMNFTNESIIKILKDLQISSQSATKYTSYFLLNQRDRKMKYVQIISKLADDRHQFLKNPSNPKFSRNQQQISVLDSIQKKHVLSMYNSLKLDHRPSNTSTIPMNSSKLWKSDLHKFQTQNPSFKYVLSEIAEEKGDLKQQKTKISESEKQPSKQNNH